jgi:hypothetical protein
VSKRKKFGSADTAGERTDEFKPIWVRVDAKARSIYAQFLHSCGMPKKVAQETSQLPWHYLGADIRKEFIRRAVQSLKNRK